VVPQVPVCTYTHAREGEHVFAERVKKKTGTKWDRDQSCITPAGQRRAALFEGRDWGRSHAQNAPSGSRGRFSPILVERFHVRERPGLTLQGCPQTRLASCRVRLPDGHLAELADPSRAEDATASPALTVLSWHQEAA
jgi:hypothetical protein